VYDPSVDSGTGTLVSDTSSLVTNHQSEEEEEEGENVSPRRRQGAGGAGVGGGGSLKLENTNETQSNEQTPIGINYTLINFDFVFYQIY